MKKGITGFQAIVAAIVAIVVLVILYLFITGSLGKSLSTVTDVEETTLSGTTISAVKIACNRFCLEAKANPPENPAAWQTSQFCDKKFAIDLNKNSEIDADELITCSNPVIAATCSLFTNDGTQVNATWC